MRYEPISSTSKTEYGKNDSLTENGKTKDDKNYKWCDKVFPRIEEYTMSSTNYMQKMKDILNEIDIY